MDLELENVDMYVTKVSQYIFPLLEIWFSLHMRMASAIFSLVISNDSSASSSEILP